MQYQLELEIRGERATNKLRLFLLIIFAASTAFSYFLGNTKGVTEYFLAGNLFYAASPVVSLIYLYSKKFNSNVKYFCLPLELIGLFIVLYSNLLLPEVNWTVAVKSPTFFAIYFLFIGEALLRFSPRFSIITGLGCAVVYSAIYIILLTTPGIKLLSESASLFDPRGVSITDWVIGTVFLLAMSIVLAVATGYVRDLVTRSASSETTARENLKKLTELMSENRATVANINSSVTKIDATAVANESLSQEQLAAVEETSATMEELSASIKSIATMAKKQDELAEKSDSAMDQLNGMVRGVENLSHENADNGNQTLERAVKGEKELTHAGEVIRRIQEGSRQVGEIVTVINSIADRTNLLALNAAIEAARAGAEGRGFSVVADEVGKLAEMSSKNARSIEKLIQETNSVTQTGVKSIDETFIAIKSIIEGIKNMVRITGEVHELIKESGKAFAAITDDMKKIQMMSRDMRMATEEQLGGTQEIIKAIDSINTSAEKFVQTSASLRLSMSSLEEANRRLGDKISTASLA